jgi:hypothetical protein
VMSLAAAQFDTGRRAVPESTIGGQTTCIVCFVNPKSHAAVPCGHKCACGDCSALVRESARSAAILYESGCMSEWHDSVQAQMMVLSSVERLALTKCSSILSVLLWYAYYSLLL